MIFALAQATAANMMQAEALKVLENWDLERSCHNNKLRLACLRQVAELTDTNP